MKTLLSLYSENKKDFYFWTLIIISIASIYSQIDPINR